ncbi:MAG: DUF1987 domain-containing protein [Clostridia bacterium]
MIVKANDLNTLPYFSLDEFNGIIEIKGRSIAVEADEHFEPILDYLQNFLIHNPMDMTVIFNLEFFNTKTSRILLNMLKMIKKATSDNDYKLIINWYYENDDDSKETGEDYQNIIGVPFNFIEI